MTRTKKISQEEKKLWHEFVKDVKPLHKNSIDPIETDDISSILEEKEITDVENLAAKKSLLIRKERKRNETAKRVSIDTKKAREIKKKGLKTEAKLDLHGLTQNMAYDRLCRFVEQNWLRGVRNLLIITGKGKDLEGSGILRQMLPKWLGESKFDKMILHITNAKPSQGGDGAFYVVLRKNRENI
ncbi:MAG: Smr/MutS family protein [Alphaproteobacteria bacterium]